MSRIEQFNAKMMSLRDVFSRFYEIPDMQRDYQWDITSGDKHGKKLLDSIVGFVDEDHDNTDCYYIGTMITYPEKEKWMVVDGQQRLTTLSLMYIAARDVFDQTYRDYPNLNLEYRFSGSNIKLSEIGDYMTQEFIGTKNKPKLLPKESSKANYNAFINGYIHRLGSRPEFQTKANNKFRVVQAFEMFENEFKQKFDVSTPKGIQELADFLDNTLDGIAINMTEVNDLAQGYRIFSSENTTGLKLGNADILRALMLAHADRKRLTKDEMNAISAYLKAAMTSLDSLPSQSIKNNFVRHFWIMRTGTPMSKAKLTEEISKDISKLSDFNSMMNFCMKIMTAASYYGQKAINPEKQSYNYFNKILTKAGFKQHIPILLALGHRNNVSNKDYERFFYFFEILFARMLLIGRKRASTIEPYAAKWAKQALDQSNSPDDLLEMWLDDAEKKIDDTEDNTLISSLKMSTIENEGKLKLILSCYENQISPGSFDKKIFSDSTVKGILPSVNSPNDWEQAWSRFSVDDYANKLHNQIGNYVILESDPKHDINVDWEVKKELFGNSIFSSTLRISENDSWTRATIKQNSGNIASKVIQGWRYSNLRND